MKQPNPWVKWGTNPSGAKVRFDHTGTYPMPDYVQIDRKGRYILRYRGREKELGFTVHAAFSWEALLEARKAEMAKLDKQVAQAELDATHPNFISYYWNTYRPVMVDSPDPEQRHTPYWRGKGRQTVPITSPFGQATILYPIDNSILRFSAHCPVAKIPMVQVSHTALQDWINTMLRVGPVRKKPTKANPERTIQEPYSVSTMATTGIHVMQVFERAADEGVVVKNPWNLVIFSKNTQTRDRVMTEDEQKTFFEGFSPSKRRLALFYLGTGLRLNEGLSIDFGSPKVLKLDGRYPQFFGWRKGRGKMIWIPLMGKLIGVDVKELLDAEIEHVLGHGGNKLWDMTPKTVDRLFAENCKRTGIAGITPHVLRHTFATRFGKKHPEQIYRLQLILDHKSLATTQKRYLHNTSEDVMEMFEKPLRLLKRGA